jgi:hypothetical protein
MERNELLDLAIMAVRKERTHQRVVLGRKTLVDKARVRFEAKLAASDEAIALLESLKDAT